MFVDGRYKKIGMRFEVTRFAQTGHSRQERKLRNVPRVRVGVVHVYPVPRELTRVSVDLFNFHEDDTGVRVGHHRVDEHDAIVLLTHDLTSSGCGMEVGIGTCVHPVVALLPGR